MAGVIIEALGILKAGVHLIERIIGQMDVHILHVGAAHLIAILFSCKSDKTVLKEEDLERFGRCHQHVEPDVKFEAIYQVRVLDVLLNDILVVALTGVGDLPKIVDLSGQVNALALRQLVGLHDHGESLRILLVEELELGEPALLRLVQF